MRRRTGLTAAVVTAAAMAGALGGPALASASTVPARSAPAAKTTPMMKKEQGAAGYLVALAASATSVTTKSVITVPKTTCGKGFYSPAVAAAYTSGLSTLGASVELSLGCFGKVKAYGDAVLTVGAKSKDSKKPLKAGTKVTITVTVTGSAATVSIAYSKKDVVTLKGVGGKPAGVLVGSLLPNITPKYAPIKFAATTIDKKALSTFKPTAYAATTKAGKVIGVPSKIAGKGQSFSISY